MSKSMEQAREKTKELVAKFHRLGAAERKGLNEAATKQGFILPLFEALGWDIEDTNEVRPEEKVSKGWVDYSLCLEGIPKIFIEAKKVSADLTKKEWITQATSYAWTKGVTWAVLTDFEGLRVFNAEWKELHPLQAQFLEFTIDNYLEDFDRLWWLSREEIEKGRLDFEAERVGKKAHKEPVTAHLFEDLLDWRENLFKHLRAYNTDYSPEQIDHAVLRILNRMVFLRTAEDREIEPVRLLSLLRELEAEKRIQELVPELADLFREMDDVYDSDLFAENYSEKLECEPEPFRKLIEGLYEKPGGYLRYNFNAIDADVLGTVYEQYLGHRIKGVVEASKGRKKKSEGIYYTPTEVVKHIISECVAIAERNFPSETDQIRTVDITCGSGSFLIEAFEVIYDFEAAISEGSELTDLEKYESRLEVLKNSIYGVDRDPEAIEVAKLNLSIKSLTQRSELPMLENIRHGDSLIEGDDEVLVEHFKKTFSEREKFHWSQEFPEVFSDGGFEVVVGNPPYVSYGLRGTSKKDRELDSYLRWRFPESAEYKLSTYAIFINRGIELARDGGAIGYIIPDSFLLGRYFSKLRRYTLDTCKIKEIILFSKDFWTGGTVGLPVIIIVEKSKDQSERINNTVEVKLCAGLTELRNNQFEEEFSYQQEYFEGIAHNRFRLFFDQQTMDIVEKLENQAKPLDDYAQISSGLIGRGGKDSIVSNKDEGPEWLPGLISGAEIFPFHVGWDDHYICFDHDKLKSGFKNARYDQPKLFMRQTGDSLIVAYDDSGFLCLNNLHVINVDHDAVDSKYLMSILNSHLLHFFYRAISLEAGRAMAQTDIETIERLPIAVPNLEDGWGKDLYTEIIETSEQIMKTSSELAEAVFAMETERHDLRNKIIRQRIKLDQLVYKGNYSGR